MPAILCKPRVCSRTYLRRIRTDWIAWTRTPIFCASTRLHFACCVCVCVCVCAFVSVCAQCDQVSGMHRYVLDKKAELSCLAHRAVQTDKCVGDTRMTYVSNVSNFPALRTRAQCPSAHAHHTCTAQIPGRDVLHCWQLLQVTFRVVSSYLYPCKVLIETIGTGMYTWRTNSLKQKHVKAVVYFRRALKLDRHCLSAWTLMGHE